MLAFRVVRAFAGAAAVVVIAKRHIHRHLELLIGNFEFALELGVVHAAHAGEIKIVAKLQREVATAQFADRSHRFAHGDLSLGTGACVAKGDK